MSKINVYVIYSPHLENRQKYINSTIDFLKKTTESIGFTFNINIITEPSKEFIDKNIETFNKRVKYEKYPDNTQGNREFNTHIQPLNSCQISNYEKHREIYRHIKDKSDDEFHMIIEDDVVIGQEYTHNIEQLFKKLHDKAFDDWDILFTCLPSLKQDAKMQLVPVKDVFSTLMCKSSYFVKASLCKRLYEYTDTFKFTLKNALSRFFYENEDVKAVYLNKHTFLEASKIGILPTTVNPNNFLFQNNHYIQLSNLSNSPEITEDIVKNAEKLYEESKSIDSADILHIMGIIYFKHKNYANAKQFMTSAISNMKKNNGYLQQNSELLNNCINIYQYEQSMLEECKKSVPKYS